MNEHSNMNWLFLLESCASGLLAGLITYFAVNESNSWNVLVDFRAGLLTVSTFCGLFCGLVVAIPVFVAEKKPFKFLNKFVFAGSLGAVIPTIGVIFFKLLAEAATNIERVPGKTDRFLWWMMLACALSASFGVLNGGYKNFSRALMGIMPAFLVAGELIDQKTALESIKIIDYFVIGGVTGLGYGIVWDLLRESWLDEDAGKLGVFRFYLDAESFWVGNSKFCDITLDFGAEVVFQIIEKDGMHILEASEEGNVQLNEYMVRYKLLADGDVIKAENRTFRYHTRVARSRDIVPEVA